MNDNTLRSDKTTRYDRQSGQYGNLRAINFAGARENVGTQARDSAYQKEKMLLCKQEEHEIQLSAKQGDWRDDADDELEDQEQEAHYMYISNIQEVILDVADNSGPIFDTEPMEKVHTNDDNYNVFANERQHPEQPESVNDTYLVEQGDSSNMSNNGGKADPNDQMLQKERQLFVFLIEQMKIEIDGSKQNNKSLESSNKALREANMFLNNELKMYKESDFAKNKLNPTAKRLTNDVVEFYQTLKEEMVVNLKYFKSLENEVESLQSQLELQQTQFSNKINRLLREYYYVDHINAIIGVYNNLDEYSGVACDYLEAVAKCERLENELSKRNENVENKLFNELSKTFAELEKHYISIELSL
ncbi:hypothetical protein Tco_0753639 [Tanacetum coccineum]